ncbi:hypothetical protein OUZ56_004857 [Daphnia magna]|uniref:Uncharacterized protein n=1 Tax=Daphnia magna TaxID=35525 RepID=A0ABQ9YR39_9CRUS|nr:hypothetical protein OUZ56_004857 [Daphnia magna]
MERPSDDPAWPGTARGCVRDQYPHASLLPISPFGQFPISLCYSCVVVFCPQGLRRTTRADLVETASTAVARLYGYMVQHRHQQVNDEVFGLRSV